MSPARPKPRHAAITRSSPVTGSTIGGGISTPTACATGDGSSPTGASSWTGPYRAAGPSSPWRKTTRDEHEKGRGDVGGKEDPCLGGGGADRVAALRVPGVAQRGVGYRPLQRPGHAGA